MSTVCFLLAIGSNWFKVKIKASLSIKIRVKKIRTPILPDEDPIMVETHNNIFWPKINTR
jgi:hypothetical protein